MQMYRKSQSTEYIQRLKNFIKEDWQQKTKLNPAAMFTIYVGNLAQGNKSICGKLISEGELSFQCYDCCIDPHHVYCRDCFILDKHRNHKFMLKYNAGGGCCDCGSKEFQLEGNCDVHQGTKHISIQEDIESVPPEHVAKIQKFFEVIITYSTTSVRKYLNNENNNDFPVWLFQLYHLREQLNIENGFQEMLEEAVMSVCSPQHRLIAKKYEKSVFLFNRCFEFMAWLIELGMPYMFIITDALMVVPDQEVQQLFKINTSETLLELLVTTHSVIQHGCYESRNIDDILYRFHGDDKFTRYFHQVMLKHHKAMIFTRVEPCSLPYLQLKSLDPKIPEHLMYYPHYAFQYLAYHMKLVKENKKDKSQRKGLYSQIYSHHSQYVSYDHQVDFFFSDQLGHFFDALSEVFNQISTPIQQDLEQICHNISWILQKLDTPYYPQVLYKQLAEIFGEDGINSLVNTPLSSQKIQQLTAFKARFFLCQFLTSLSKQQPLNIDENSLFKFGPSADLIFHNIQLILVSILTRSLTSLQQQNPKGPFLNNLFLLLTQHVFDLLVLRNKTPDIDISCIKSNPKKAPALLVAVFNAPFIDRCFSMLIINTFCQLQLSQKDYVDFITRVLKIEKNQFYFEFSKAVNRAIQSFPCVGGEGLNHLGFSMYFGRLNQQRVNLSSMDIGLIKMFIYLFGSIALEDVLKFIERQYNVANGQQFLGLRLLLDILLTDQDIYNVTCMFFTELPIDARYHFKKHVLTVFIEKNYQSFTRIVKHLTQQGIVNHNNFSEHLKTICELDMYLREFKLKPELFNSKVYEPEISQAGELKTLITEKLQESKSDLNPFFGNALMHDFKNKAEGASATMGPIRAYLWDLVLENETFTSYIMKETSHIPQAIRSLENEIRFVNAYVTAYRFRKKEPHILLTEELVNQLLQQLKAGIISLQTTTQQDELRKITKMFEYIEQLNRDSQNPQPQIQQLLQINQSSKKQSIQEKFRQKQLLFNKQCEQSDDKEQSTEKKGILCAICKQNMEANEITSPGHLDYHTLEQYLPMRCLNKTNLGFARSHLIICSHRFHAACLDNSSKNIGIGPNSPIELQRSCPICKLTMTIVVRQEYSIDEGKYLYVRDDDLITLINFREEVGEYYYSKYESITNNKQQELLICSEILLSIVTNLLNQVLTDLPLFFERGDDYIVVSFIRQIQRTIKSMKPVENISNLFVFQLGVQQQDEIVVLIKQVNQHLVEFQNSDFKFNSQRTFLVNSLSSFLEQLTDNLTSQIHQVQILGQPQGPSLDQYLIEKLGLTFEIFYKRFIQEKCSKCQYYPKKLLGNSTELPQNQMFVCLICQVVLCGGICLPNIAIGNLNKHAQVKHNNQAIFISLATGCLTDVFSPCTFFQTRQLFYNSKGQAIDLRDHKEDWSQFMLDNRVLKSTLQILTSRSLPSRVVSLTEDQMQNIDIEQQI